MLYMVIQFSKSKFNLGLSMNAMIVFCETSCHLYILRQQNVFQSFCAVKPCFIIIEKSIFLNILILVKQIK